jgi:hypothetical protein
MRLHLPAIFLMPAMCLFPVVIDQIAITVNNYLIKDSDIDRDLLATELLDGDRPDVSAAARKKDASHLIDQVLIREEIRDGGYPGATADEAQAQMDQLLKQRFHTEAELDAALKRYQLTQADLLGQFQWQLTVLRFIDSRFRPAVLPTDKDPEAAINRLLFAWLDERRHAAKIIFLEKALQ